MIVLNCICKKAKVVVRCVFKVNENHKHEKNFPIAFSIHFDEADVEILEVTKNYLSLQNVHERIAPMPKMNGEITTKHEVQNDMQ